MSRAPGFVAGAATLTQALGELRRTPRLWPTAMVPALVFLALFGLGLFAAGRMVVPPLLSWAGLDAPDSWYGRASELVLSGALWVVSALLSAWAGLVLTPAVSAPALERLVASEEERLGAATRAPQSWLAEFWCGIRAQAFATLFVTPLLVLLWVVELALPFMGLIMLPLKIALMASALAWNLLDYPLTLRGVALRDRFRFVRRFPRPILGFGLVFAALFWLPCAGVLLLPVGAMAATRLVWTLLRADPTVLPVLTADYRAQAPHQVDPQRR